MDKLVLHDIRDISGRLDSLVTFAIIRFVYAVYILYFSNDEIILFSVIIALVLSLLMNHPKISSALFVLSEQVQKISLLVLSQATIAKIGIDPVTDNYKDIPTSIIVQSMTVVTCILILSSVIPEYFQDSDVVQRCVTLLLYIYAEATETVFQELKGGILPTFICVFLYMCLHKYNDSIGHRFSVRYVLRALNMVTINFILRALTDVNMEVANLQIQTILYIVVLFLLDTLSHISPMFEETRDYAMWKVSQQLFRVYARYKIDTMVSVAISFLVLATRGVFAQNTQLVFQLLILVVVSIVLDAAAKYLQTAASVDKSIMLFLYVIGIHRIFVYARNIK